MKVQGSINVEPLNKQTGRAQSPTCSICGASGGRVVSRDSNRRDGLLLSGEYVRCAGCGHLYMWPMPTPAELASFYERMRQNETPAADKTERANRASRLARDVFNRIEYKLFKRSFERHLTTHQFLPPITKDSKASPRLLDLGCGEGIVLAGFANRGWSLYGVDISPTAIERAGQRVPSATLVAGELIDSDRSFGPFDLVRLDNVLEHVLDPVSVLRAAFERLAPGGHLALYVPHGNSLSLRWFRTRSVSHWVPFHLHLFTQDSLVRALHQAGFRVLEVRFLDPPSWWTLTMSQALHPKRNLASYGGAATEAIHLRLAAMPFRVLSRLAGGEELVALARKEPEHQSQMTSETEASFSTSPRKRSALAGFKQAGRSVASQLGEAYERAQSAYRLSKLPKTYSRDEYLRARQEALEQYYRCRSNASAEDGLTHPAWSVWRNSFRVALEEGLPECFLNHPVLLQTMVRQGNHQGQAYEEQYLRRRSAAARRAVASIKESFVGHPRIVIQGYDWSATTLGHAYYLARMIDLLDVGRQAPADTVMEFGGGYGNLCRMFRQAVSNRTYIIVDLCEFIALQVLFLRLSLPSESIHVIAGDEEPLVAGAINLVPVGLWQSLRVKPDLFLSTFALSESPYLVQKTAIAKKFYEARSIYLVGQHRINGLQTDAVWEELGVEYPWQQSETLIEGVRSCYKKVEINSFHIGDNYELAAMNPK